MKTFKDWANQEIQYDFRYDTLHEDTDEKEWTCYLKLNGDWMPLGSGSTKDKALADAIREWNYVDNEGRW